MIDLKLAKDKFDGLVQKGSTIKLQDLLRIAGRAVASYLRQWFFDLDAKRPNQLGGARTHFYAGVARSVQQPVVTAERALIDIRAVGLMQRWLGGIIRAGSGISSATGALTKWLAIPARAEAYGKTPSEFNDLHFVPPGNGHPGFLAQNLQTEVRLGKKLRFSPDLTSTTRYKAETVGGLAMFWLVKQVNQKADPSVMPTEGQMVSAMDTAVSGYLRTKLETN
jgi:hypothetical protein